MKQATLNLDLNTRKTRKRGFLEQMEQVVPWWSAMVELIARYYPPGRTGRPPFSSATTSRVIAETDSSNTGAADLFNAQESDHLIGASHKMREFTGLTVFGHSAATTPPQPLIVPKTGS